MAGPRRFFARLLTVFRSSRAEEELSRELEAHLVLMEDDLRRKGMTDDQARRAARRAFGGVQQAKDHHRDARSFVWTDDLWRDLQYALRTLLRNRGFAIVAIATLALGISANTAVFTVADALLFRPPPFDHAERLHWIYDVNGSQGFALKDDTPPSPANFLDWRDQTRSFDYMVAWRNWFSSVSGTEGAHTVAEQVRGVSVSPAFFDMLGVQPVLGRVFRQDEEQPGRDYVVVLANGLWKRYFAADPAIVGKTVLIDGRPFSIVGVLPADFSFLQPDFEMWMPLAMDAAARTQRASHSIAVLARLAPGVTQADAASDLTRITRNLERAYPATNAGWGAGLRAVFPLNGDLRGALFLLLGAVSCVLLIACINVAGLLLVRAGARQRELAVRAALGASRGRLARQMLTESGLLAGMGAGLGVLLAMGSLGLIKPFLPQVTVSRPLALTVDMRALLFTLAATVVTSLTVGLFPAVQSSRAERLTVSGAPVRRTMVGRTLSVVEIAASLILLIGAGLLIKTLWNLQRIDPGFHPGGLLTMQLWLPEAKYAGAADVSQFPQEVLRRLDRFPEVQAAAVVNTRPFQGWRMGATVNLRGETPHALGGDPIVGLRVISPKYFAVLGTPVIQGRDFLDSDGPNSEAVALVNDVMARRFWPTANPIGQSIRVRSLGAPSTAPWWPDQMTDTFVIVGVVGNIRETSLVEPIEPTVYLANLQNPSRYLHLLVRTASTPATATGLVQRTVRTVDPDLGFYDVLTMKEALDRAVGQPRFNVLLWWAFATAALILSAVGVYGVTSHGVDQRSREFAIRLAVGASPWVIFRMVTRHGLMASGIGILMGLGGAVMLGRILTSFLYGVVPTDGTTLVGSGVAVLAVTLVASWWPAYRATKVDPIVTLRCD